MSSTAAAPRRASTSKCFRDIGVVVPAREGNVVRYTLSDQMSGQVIEQAVGAFDQMQPIGGGAGEELSAGV